ncbi:MAG: BatA domain-containing protein [Opitutales bacterium]
MSFLNGALLAGAAAFLIPLIIHIFNRSRFQIITWGAMHLLESVLRVNRKQVQLEQIILLIIRCAIPILLALCLARMVVTEWGPFVTRLILPLAALGFLILVALVPSMKKLFGTLCAACLLAVAVIEAGVYQLGSEKDKVTSLSGEVPASTVILLDDSFSMRAGKGFEKASAFTSGLLENLKKGSDASIIRMGGEVSPVFAKPTSETNELGQRAEKLVAAYDKVDVAESFSEGVRTVLQGRNAKREIILVSDFRKADWNQMGASLADLKKSIDGEPVPPEITFIDVGSESKNNVSVESIELSASTVGVGQKIHVRAEVVNHGSSEYKGDLPVRLYDENNSTKTMAETIISLKPNETGQVLFTHVFDKAGSRVVTVDADPGDGLREDDKRSASITVLERIGVLLVDGNPSEEWLAGETDFLKLALTPFGEAVAKGSAQTKDLIDATVAPIHRFDPDSQLVNQSVVVLANVSKMSDEQVTAIGNFVRNGGGLWICLGDQVDATWYNSALGPEAQDILPLPVLSLGGSVTDDSLRTRVVASHFEHPALTIFNDRRNGNLADADVWAWLRLGEDDANRLGSATVLARLETGDPFIAEKKLGKGVVIQSACSIDGDWSNMPVRSCYLPLVQQLASYLADQVTPPRNLPAGATLAHFLPEKDAGKKINVQGPDGISSVKAVKRGSQAVVEFSGTRRPGTYAMTGDGVETARFVVNSSPRESLLARLTDEEIATRATALGLEPNEIIKSADDDPVLDQYLKLDGQRKFGRETWKILLWTLLGLVFVELILQRIFGRVRA